MWRKGEVERGDIDDMDYRVMRKLWMGGGVGNESYVKEARLCGW